MIDDEYEQALRQVSENPELAQKLAEKLLARYQENRELREAADDRASWVRWASKQIVRGNSEATLTSGFEREILRLTPLDVKFLTDCGIRVE